MQIFRNGMQVQDYVVLNADAQKPVNGKPFVNALTDYYGKTQFPMVFINGQFIGGPQKIYQLYGTGQLKTML